MGKLFIFSLAVIAALFIPGLGYTLEQPAIKAELDKTCAGPGEFFTYKLTIKSPDNNAAVLKPPSFNDFNVLSAARSAEMEVVADKVITSEVYVYALLPRKNGKLRLGPAQLTVKGVEYSTASFDIEVKGSCAQSGKNNSTEKMPRELPDSTQPQYVL